MEVSKKVLDELVALMQREGLERLRIEISDLDLDLRMTAGKSAVAPAGPPAAQTPQPKGAAAAAASGPAAGANVQRVLAPLVGVFYRAPAPGAKPFVEVGDVVAPGQVLCILEAMKLMNEIVSEYGGTVIRICANDGDLVGLQQELYWIEA